MKVLFDTNFLIWAIRPDKPPEEIDSGQERIDYLIETLDKKNAQIIIPSPAFAEFLAGLDDEDQKTDYINQINKNKRFQIAPFDTMCAIEHSFIVQHKEIGSSKQKMKFDFQIVTIAKVNNVDLVYSHDSDVIKLCNYHNIDVKDVNDLLLPPEEPQQDLIKNLEKAS
jgi:predicted nucleic acid-binding protein